ncbi:AraC family transcriptional regulator, partial [Escherichia coli]
ICGYENTSYFVSVFRRYFGVPPHQYSPVQQ